LIFMTEFYHPDFLQKWIKKFMKYHSYTQGITLNATTTYLYRRRTDERPDTTPNNY